MSVKKQQGFTLVELVIVLAIAAIIIAGVLIAVGGAQRSQRDQSRKSIATRVGQALENYASNHNGTYDGFACDAATYCKGITDPDTNTAPTVSNAAGTTNADQGVKAFVPQTAANNGFVCNAANDAAAAGTNKRQYAIVYWSENSNTAQCLDNNH